MITKINFLTEPVLHNHDPLAFESTVAQTNNCLKLDALNENKNTSQIIRDSTVATTKACRIYLPSKPAQKSKISRIRRKTSLLEPRSLQEIEIPDNIRFIDGELFVLSEDEFNGQKNIILGTKSSLKLLAEAKCWLMDGTFYVAPKMMRQLFSIHGKIGNEIVPLVFCLMSKKSKESYSQFFYKLCEIACNNNVDLNPQRIISDFEKTIYSAAKLYFPTAEYKGCLFHFGQIIWRQVQKHGLTSKYGKLLRNTSKSDKKQQRLTLKTYFFNLQANPKIFHLKLEC